jgi:hypothetical protein
MLFYYYNDHLPHQEPKLSKKKELFIDSIIITQQFKIVKFFYTFFITRIKCGFKESFQNVLLKLSKTSLY